MRRPNQRSWSQLKVGLVIVLAVLGILVAILNLNEGMGVFTLRSLFSALLNDSQGLKVGAPVRMSGVDVGNVKRIEIDPDKGKVEVLFTVKNEIRALLHTDAAVIVRPMGLLGDKYLEIVPGNLRLPPLPDGAVLAGRGETDITGVADTATATLMNVNQTLKDIQGILAGFKEGKGTLGKLVTDPELYDRTAQLIRKAEGVSEQTGNLLSKIERGEGTLGKLMTDRAFYDRATAAVDELQKLGALLNRPDGSLGKLARDPALYQRLEGITAKGEALVGKIEHGEGTIGKLVNQDQLYERTDKVLTEMEALLADVKKNPTKYFKFSVF
jgi:phospholipid/cholesterol/gamma-HCH transport system substrate-binding protein